MVPGLHLSFQENEEDYMDNNNSDFNLNSDVNSEANGPTTEESSTTGSSDRMSMMKGFGRKGLAPIIEVFTKHQGDLTPYVQSIDKALSAATPHLIPNQRRKQTALWEAGSLRLQPG